jgi:hypothetical protein
MFNWFKKRLLYWLLDVKQIKIGELFESSNPQSQKTYNEENLLFINEGKTDYWIITPNGPERIKRTLKTIPLKIIELKTENNSIRCSEDHLLKIDNIFKKAKEYKINDKITTINGNEKIISIKHYGYDNCYDLEIDSKEHEYYSDNFISHNSTCMVSYILWYSQFHRNKTILISGNKFSAAIENMDRIRDSYEALDMWIKRGVTEYNKATIRFDNGTKIIASATTPNAGRGRSVNLLFLDELAFVNERFAREYWSAIQPTLGQTKGKCIIASTPRADTDLFYELWEGANDLFDENGEPNPRGIGRNGFKPLFYPWYVHPERGPEWEKEWRAKLGKNFLAEMECLFVSDEETLVDSMVLKDIKPKNPLFDMGTSRWWKEPEPNKVYICSLDPCVGTGRDYSVIQIFSLNPFEQIAEWRNNTTDLKGQCRMLINMMGYIWDNLIENPNQRGDPELYWTFENNSIGTAIVEVVKDNGEEAFPGQLINVTSSGSVKYGYFTGKHNKLKNCIKMKSLIETKKMTINSSYLLNELKNYLSSGGSYAAKPGYHDDAVSAVLLIIGILNKVMNWSEQEIEDLKETLDDNYEEDVPAVIF